MPASRAPSASSFLGGVICFGTDELDARNKRLFAELAELPPPARGGYMLVPAILPVDLWEEQALEAQAQLVRETGEWLGPATVVTGPDPMDVTNRYKPDKSRTPPSHRGSEA